MPTERLHGLRLIRWSYMSLNNALCTSDLVSLNAKHLKISGLEQHSWLDWRPAIVQMRLYGGCNSEVMLTDTKFLTQGFPHVFRDFGRKRMDQETFKVADPIIWEDLFHIHSSHPQTFFQQTWKMPDLVLVSWIQRQKGLLLSWEVPSPVGQVLERKDSENNHPSFWR